MKKFRKQIYAILDKMEANERAYNKKQKRKKRIFICLLTLFVFLWLYIHKGLL